MGTNKSVRLVGQREIWRVYNNNSEVGANREMLNNLRVVNPNSHKIALINMPVEWGCLCAYCVVLDLAMFCVCGRVYLCARCMRPQGQGQNAAVVAGPPGVSWWTCAVAGRGCPGAS